ncbi:tRNA pseudouridine synthase B [Periweissella fabaria]|uniref:tRNA pseudouridine synthase B n=2 Tax=Periweissella fabaria TaxID=546157 RepID=A0ABN8BD53_9LACO|nr:tRNA pseudouridine(55) synthase TruB [Periweissella fabaria]CAH0415735.1 tRNA pseudouridine synthase B [Periweissella fabaria]
MDGIIPVYKERGMTSHDVVFKLRKILHTKKIGHSGTLDPNVDGVLPVAVGHATKAVEYLVNSGKIYRGAITLGFATTTEDLDGEIIASAPVVTPFDDATIDATLAKLTGEITQIPPMFSAVKVNGRKLYEYARAGETVERPERQVTIGAFTQIKASEYDAQKQQQTIYFEVHASKGTYVRTLAVDFGKLLDLPATMTDLTRIKSGGFDLAQAVKLSEIADKMEAGTVATIMFPIDRALGDIPAIDMTDEHWSKMKNGAWFGRGELDTQATVVRMRYQDDTKALYHWDTEKHLYRPLKIFNNQD